MKSRLFAFMFTVLASASGVCSTVTVVENSGFCSAGAPQAISIPIFGSYCEKGDETVGRLATSSFQLTGPFEIYLSGNVNRPGLSLGLENLSSHQVLSIRPMVPTGIEWRRFAFEIPPPWKGRDLRLVAADEATSSMGWLAFSAPLTPDRKDLINAAKKILIKTPLFVFLIFLPGYALAAFAVRRKIQGTVNLGLITLAGMALPGYLTFFLYVLSAKAGHMASLITPFITGGSLIFLLGTMTREDRSRFKVLLAPLGLVLFASMAILSLGYLYGGMAAPDATAQNRFSHPLPPDNTIPSLFAEKLIDGSVPKPLQGDWLSSDRPPLQTGMLLVLAPWVKSRTVWYHVASVSLESLWIFAVWLTLKALKISSVTTALIVGTISLSGFSIVNTFYVWPKLLAATYTIAFAIPIVAGGLALNRKWVRRFLLSLLLVFSLLAHGGSIFALLGLFPVIILRFRRQIRAAGTEVFFIGIIALVLYSPWMGYQKFKDPPGDRLIKFHLAGVEQLTSESALQTIYHSYRPLTLSDWIAAKKENEQPVFFDEFDYLAELAKLGTPLSMREVRVLEFFYFLPSLGLTAVGAIGLLLPWKRYQLKAEMRAAKILLFWALSSLVPWILLMFKPASTVVHQGAYATVLVAMTGCILAFRAVAPRVAIAICALQSALHWVIYHANLSHAAFPLSLQESENHWMMAVHVVSLLGFFGMLMLVARYVPQSDSAHLVNQPQPLSNLQLHPAR